MLESILIALLGALLITLPGLLVWWLFQRERFDAGLPWNRLRPRSEVAIGVIRFAALPALIGGLLAAGVLLFSMSGIFLCVVALVILITVVVQYFAAEQQSLLWMLTVAAERDIPLESAARAFAEERHDLIGRRAMLLADNLEAGVPLSLALKRAGIFVPSAIQLAADLGPQAGGLGQALRQATGTVDENEATIRWMLERLFYPIFLVVACVTVMIFLAVRIVPTIQKMMDEFELELPWMTQALIQICDFIFDFSPLFILILLLGGFVVSMGGLWYTGIAPRSLVLFNRLWRSADRALVMQWLATAVREDLPLSTTVRTLALCFPERRVRARLERASSRIDRGADWCDSLRAAGLLRRAESQLFKSAERAGNLPWALDEMAKSCVRRTIYRIRAWVNVAVPAAVLLLGVVVLFIASAVLMVLFGLIQGLS